IESQIDESAYNSMQLIAKNIIKVIDESKQGNSDINSEFQQEFTKCKDKVCNPILSYFMLPTIVRDIIEDLKNVLTARPGLFSNRKFTGLKISRFDKNIGSLIADITMTKSASKNSVSLAIEIIRDLYSDDILNSLMISKEEETDDSHTEEISDSNPPQQSGPNNQSQDLDSISLCSTANNSRMHADGDQTRSANSSKPYQTSPIIDDLIDHYEEIEQLCKDFEPSNEDSATNLSSGGNHSNHLHQMSQYQINNSIGNGTHISGPDRSHNHSNGQQWYNHGQHNTIYDSTDENMTSVSESGQRSYSHTTDPHQSLIGSHSLGYDTPSYNVTPQFSQRSDPHTTTSLQSPTGSHSLGYDTLSYNVTPQSGSYVTQQTQFSNGQSNRGPYTANPDMALQFGQRSDSHTTDPSQSLIGNHSLGYETPIYNVTPQSGSHMTQPTQFRNGQFSSRSHTPSFNLTPQFGQRSDLHTTPSLQS
ncbi:MAG: hypothetical protein MHMPM18_004973, partial [Marteilia pararefringens]